MNLDGGLVARFANLSLDDKSAEYAASEFCLLQSFRDGRLRMIHLRCRTTGPFIFDHLLTLFKKLHKHIYLSSEYPRNSTLCNCAILVPKTLALNQAAIASYGTQIGRVCRLVDHTDTICVL